VFEKTKESSQHLKPLYVRGHIDGMPISRMLIDGGAVINLMSYFVFTMEAKGVISMELTMCYKSLTTTFFIIDVKGNYSVILDHDWIQANQCVRSTLHQFFIQWIDNEIEVAHTGTSSYITLTDASADWQHESAKCLSGRDILGYDFLSVIKDGFVPISV
jgi:hypothetical protein